MAKLMSNRLTLVNFWSILKVTVIKSNQDKLLCLGTTQVPKFLPQLVFVSS